MQTIFRKGFSTSPLKNHLERGQTTGSSEDTKATTELQRAAGTITAYLEPAEKSPRYYIAKMVVMKHLPLSFVEDLLQRCYNRKADPLEWWKTRKALYPLLANGAKSAGGTSNIC